MMRKVTFTIMFFMMVVVMMQPVGVNFTISVSDIPDDGDGYMIRGTTFNNNDGTFNIVIDTVTMQSSEWQVVMMHEIGHVNNWNWTEEEVDNFANSQGVGYIHDGTY